MTDLDRGDQMTVSAFQLGGHAGTHIDAPKHFIAGANGIETIPVDVLIGEVTVVEIADQVDTITQVELSAIPKGATRVLLKTRNSGWSKNDTSFRDDYVALDESAARWLVEQGVRLLGIDYLSVGPFDEEETDFAVHKVLLQAGVVIVESLDLEDVTPGQYRLIVLPLLIPGSDGAPARAILEVV